MKSYITQINELSEKAINHIKEILPKEGIVLYDSKKEEDEQDVDIYDLPDFQIYDKNGPIEWCTMVKVYYDKDNKICVVGLGKETGREYTITLSELEAYSSCSLADELIHTLQPELIDQF